MRSIITIPSLVMVTLCSAVSFAQTVDCVQVNNELQAEERDRENKSIECKNLSDEHEVVKSKIEKISEDVKKLVAVKGTLTKKIESAIANNLDAREHEKELSKIDEIITHLRASEKTESNKLAETTKTKKDCKIESISLSKEVERIKNKFNQMSCTEEEL